MEIFSVIQAGGFVMIPLVLCSLLVWAVTFEKIWFLGQFQKQFHLLYQQASELLKEQKVNEAKGLYRSAHPYIAAPYLAFLEGDKAQREILEGSISRRLGETTLGLRRFLWILGTIASAAPFIGLFGTVVGIIKSFASIASTGKSGFAVVAGGLSEALIATAAGIIVAVMALVLYNYFQTRLSRLNMEFKNKLEDLMDLV
ncbi:MAG: MotA/TolQ/ExbB proton channel family protein [Halobacteriovoraceae bacterium]|jgi:biopolymer transport protein ExbB/TolQ|nr:MotA/TolQ/ExbB proton channel family protein [Halobacteriovoraceae bacterium]MBT5094324.1 MotA/TolQ/ExbB proton channel family protein [Halobacteriovoraceae bacterium]